MKKYLFAVSLATVQSKENTILECPILKCEDQKKGGPIESDLCFKHDRQQPTKILKSHDCSWYLLQDETSNKAPVVCEFDLLSKKFAWVTEQYQPEGQPEELDRSILNKKKTEAYCRMTSSMSSGLNNGRSCKKNYAWECVSQICSKEGLCVGLQL
jgi:hypothetical protein